MEGAIEGLEFIDDQCYSYLDESGKISKGVLSKSDESHACKSETPNENCILCNSDFCNKDEYKKFECHTCSDCDDPVDGSEKCYKNECATWISNDQFLYQYISNNPHVLLLFVQR